MCTLVLGASIMKHIYQWHHGSSSSLADKLCVYETSGKQRFYLPHMGHVFLVNAAYCITYDCSNKDADKKGLSFFRLPKDHKLRLTWFKKLRLVDPTTLTVSVCVVNTSLRSVSLLICKLLWGSRRQKRSMTKYAAPTLFSFTKLAVPRMLSEKRAKVLKETVWWHLILIHC